MVDQVAIPNSPYDSNSAALFTNKTGQVVFVDQPFLRLMKYTQVEKVVGEPLHKALGLDPKAAKQLFDDLLRDRLVRNPSLDVSNAAGDKLTVAYTGIATYDPTGNFLGADVILRPFGTGPLGAAVAPSAPAIPTTGPLVDKAADPAPLDHTFLELYFTSQIKGMYVLLSRLVGLWVRDNLDKTINDKARQNKTAMQIKGGIFMTSLAETDPAIYRAVLAKAQKYAVNLIGQSIVSKTIQSIDAQMHQGVLVLAAQAGLRANRTK